MNLGKIRYMTLIALSAAVMSACGGGSSSGGSDGMADSSDEELVLEVGRTYLVEGWSHFVSDSEQSAEVEIAVDDEGLTRELTLVSGEGRLVR